MNALWKQRIIDAYRGGDKPDDIARNTGYSVPVINKVLFPQNRPKVTEAIIATRPLPPNAVKKGHIIVQGEEPPQPKRKKEKKPEKAKDPKMVEAGRKAHLKKLENLKKLADKKQEDPVVKLKPDLDKAIAAPIPKEEAPHLNRKQRREAIQKPKSKWVIDDPIDPHEVVKNTTNTIIEEAKSKDVVIFEKDNKPSIIDTLEQIASLLLQVVALIKEENKN